MSILSQLTLSSVIAILSFSVYSRQDNYLFSEDSLAKQKMHLGYKNNRNFSTCYFMTLPALYLACEIIEPIATEYLTEIATIQDKKVIETVLNKKEIANILELGVKEGTYHFTVTTSIIKEVLGIQWEKIIEASFKATVKCGFDLNKGFDIFIEYSNKQIIITLPAPIILSKEVSLINLEDNENKLSGTEYNEIYESAKFKAFEYALRDGLKKQP